jgi:hypothetical protein
MQQTKSIQKLAELDGVFKKDNGLGEPLKRLLKNFNPGPVGKLLTGAKTKGICPKQIFFTLFLFPFLAVDNIRCWMQSGLNVDIEGKKDVYYSLINSPDIEWRKIVTYFARGFARTVAKHAEGQPEETKGEGSPKCMIIDDTMIHKTGKKIEFIGKVFDHCMHKCLLGFKVLTLGFWDGKSFIPLDFSVHQEPGKEKKRGLTMRELRAQYKKTRTADCPSMKRIAELAVNKIDQAVKMVAGAISQGFVPQYVLADSWFITDGFIKSIVELGAKRKQRVEVLGLMKSGRNVQYQGKTYNTDIMPKIFESKTKACRKMKCRYLALNVVYKETPIKAFFVMMNGHASWKLLITTDEKLSFIKAMEYYQIRWTIEVFFREAKQDLRLGKCQSNDFDALIATTSLTFMHYMVLALGKRFESYETMGELFRAFKDNLLEQTLIQRIWALLKGIYFNLLMALGVDWEVFIKQVITNPELKNLLHACSGVLSTVGNRPECELSIL